MKKNMPIYTEKDTVYIIKRKDKKCIIMEVAKVSQSVLGEI